MLIIPRYFMFSKALATPLSRLMSTTSTPGPVETAIRQKLSTLLNPTVLEISNDSSQHAHHKAMRESNAGSETHFSLRIVSEVFHGKSLLQRHRMIQKALSEEFAQGLHALSLKTITPEELLAPPPS